MDFGKFRPTRNEGGVEEVASQRKMVLRDVPDGPEGGGWRRPQNLPKDLLTDVGHAFQIVMHFKLSCISNRNIKCQWKVVKGDVPEGPEGGRWRRAQNLPKDLLTHVGHAFQIVLHFKS